MVAISTGALISVLPSLAALAGVLTGLENIPLAEAHTPVARSPKDHHRHLIQRQRVSEGLGAQIRKRTSFAPGTVLQRADGSQCRLRASLSSSVSSSATTSSSSSSTSTSTTTSTSTSVYVAPTTTAAALVITTSSSEVGAAWYAAPTSAAAATTQAASTSNYSGGNNGGWKNTGSKLGTAWPNGNWASSSSPDYVGNYIGTKNSWYYTWSPFSVGSADSLGLEYVPMLWGPKQVADWWAQQGSWPSTVKNALFFNEPNEGSQCNMAASDSVSYWMNDMLPLRAKGIALGGAATTSAPNGLTWVQDIISSCKNAGNSAADCTPDFIPLHWYDTTAANFQAYVQNFHQQTGLKIWITEYACQNFNGGAQCSTSEVWNLHQTMAPWFDSQDYIIRYSPFGVMKDMQGVNQDNALMNPDGSITALGSWYIYSA